MSPSRKASALTTLDPKLSRRAFCWGTLPLLLWPSELRAALPPFEGQLEDGSRANLRELAAGKVCAVQFVFTSCVTICPLLGALFSSVQRELDDKTRSRSLLLSISVDPENDTPSKLRRFLERHHAGPGWRALLLSRSDLSRLLAALGEDASSPTLHSPQTIILDSQGEESTRLRELAKASEVVAALRAAK